MRLVRAGRQACQKGGKLGSKFIVVGEFVCASLFYNIRVCWNNEPYNEQKSSFFAGTPQNS
eukprot:scaffold67862_cov99-Phaeocystis_antarctica.AAC.1